MFGKQFILAVLKSAKRFIIDFFRVKNAVRFGFFQKRSSKAGIIKQTVNIASPDPSVCAYGTIINFGRLAVF
jgi:hypothetical protein